MARPLSLPSSLVVFGITGDLAAKKIIPALWSLYQRGLLPAKWRCLGVSRRDWTDAQLRDYVGGLITGSGRNLKFLDHFVYQRVDFTCLSDYRSLAERLGNYDGEWRFCSNKLFYLAVPPELYGPMLKNLSASGLTNPCSSDEGWTRVIVEKPFGRDAKSARRLEQMLQGLLHEEQIYRIDHYLGKELLQNILTFRFANSIWRQSWNNRSIESIEVRLWEKGLVEPGRVETYDQVGALRDVGQNHLLQMLALVTMDDPGTISADAVRERRSEVLSALRFADLGLRGQYRGYKKLAGVPANSQTETYFRLTAELDLPTWRGVPIHLESGKGMPSSKKEILINFRQPRSCYCPSGRTIKRVGTITFRVEPEEGIEISFWAKKPGVDSTVEPKSLSWRIKDGSIDYSEAYERLLLDCFFGSQTLFVSSEETQSAWLFIDQIITGWKKSRQKLIHYDHGTVPAVRVEKEPMTSEIARSIGLIGLGKMGGGMAEHLLDDGWQVIAWNRTESVLDDYSARGLTGASNIQDLVSRLPKSGRIIWLMLPAGSLIDEMLSSSGDLGRFLQRGDIVIDGGNSNWQDSRRRASVLRRRGIELIDVGVSGGPVAARWGAVLMIGGDEQVVRHLEPLWQSLSLDARSYRYLGPSGAGHYAKMVHNGIEYGMMQSIAEGASLWHKSPYDHSLSDLLELYNQGSVVESRLVGWLAEGLRQVDDRLTGVKNQVDHTGEGDWALQTAKDQQLSMPAIESAVKWRRQSKNKPSYTSRLLSLMRGMFGGHAWRLKDE